MRNNGHRRMRGRGNNNGTHNNNRRGPNPLTRSYESNGPDVKIRGTAQHIVEKYSSLARDAQGSGDPVMAENYLQHAEHYFRIIAAAQEQFGINTYRRQDEDGEDGDSEDEMEDDGVIPVNQPQPYVREPFPQRKPLDGEQPQPQAQQGQRYQRDRNDRGERPQRFQRDDRPQQGGAPASDEAGDAQVVRRSRYGMTPRNPMADVDGEQPVVAVPPRADVDEPLMQPRPIRVEADNEPELPAFLMATRRTAPRRPRPARPEEVVEANEGGEE